LDVAALATAPDVTCRPTTAIAQVARLMAEHEVGSVIVVDGDGDGRRAGIVTDRDIALRGFARRLDPGAAVPPGCNDVVGIPEHVGSEAAANQLAAWAHRRLPVVDDDGVARGVITLDDLLLHCTSILERMTPVDDAPAERH
jgi:CBS domain-containing protein